MPKNRTTATKPRPALLVKPVERRMWSIVIGGELWPYGERSKKSDARSLAWFYGGKTVPVLVTVTPIRAKRARKGMR